MSGNETVFPVFRKYPDGQTLFMIESDEAFTELKRMGKYFSQTRYQAQNYADRLMIADMIGFAQPQYRASSAGEYFGTAEEWNRTLQRFSS